MEHSQRLPGASLLQAALDRPLPLTPGRRATTLCQVSEAEALVAGGITDVLVSNQVTEANE
jgi:D-serine deaminase-like pyridoxal phosphate-dependent protein